MQPTPPLPIRDQAMELIQSLPPDASWDELMYRIYVRQAIERGMADSDADQVIDVEELRRQFGLPARESRGRTPLERSCRTSTTT